MGGTLPKAALLLLCFFSLAIVACSQEPFGDPDRAGSPHAPRGTLAGEAGDLTVSGESPRQLTIEGARLQTGEEGVRIIVVVGHGGYFPECVLLEAVRGTESLWPQAGATEMAQVDESYVVVFREDPHPVGKVADPRNTPYSVLCVAESTTRAVEAHVEGTPRASRK